MLNDAGNEANLEPIAQLARRWLVFIALAFIGLVAIVGVIGSFVLLRRDGYRALPVDPDHDFVSRIPRDVR
jgi:hypothetical protein